MLLPKQKGPGADSDREAVEVKAKEWGEVAEGFEILNCSLGRIVIGLKSLLWNFQDDVSHIMK